MGQNPEVTEALEENKKRFGALKQLSQVQSELLAAFHKQQEADGGMKYSEIAQYHGPVQWGELTRFASGESAICEGRALKAVLSYTNKTELGEKIAELIKVLPGDTWRGIAALPVEAIESAYLVWEAFIRDGRDLGQIAFGQIFPENLREVVLGTILRNRELMNQFKEADARDALFNFLAGSSYEEALQEAKEAALTQMQKHAHAWKPIRDRLNEECPSRNEQAAILGVGLTTMKNLFRGTVAAKTHEEALKRATDHFAKLDAHKGKRPLSEAITHAIARLNEARTTDPTTYSVQAMSNRFEMKRSWLSRVLRGETPAPEDFAELAKRALPELFPSHDGAPVEAAKPNSADPEEKRECPPQHTAMPDALIAATVEIGLAGVKNSVRALEDWDAATNSQLPFTQKQLHDMARYAARLIRLSGLTPQEVSLAITGEPVSEEDLRGVFGAMQQEDRRRG